MENTAQIEIGTPAYQDFYGCSSKRGYVAEIKDAPEGLYMIGAGGLTPEKLRLVIAWDNATLSEVSEGIARPWLETAHKIGMTPQPAIVAEMLATAKSAAVSDRARRAAESEFAKSARGAFESQVRPMIPECAQAVIIAELIQDKSDSQTDYFGGTTVRTIVLAWSTHKRDLFPEMRKAARNHPEVAHLADVPADVENRQKWSMGGGYFLKEGGRYSDGWKISKSTFYGDDKARNVPTGELALTPPAPVKAAPVATASAPDAGGFAIEEHTHTKKGFQMWIVIPAERVERDVYDSLLARAKDAGGWYSRKWGTTPAGFAFKSQDAAQAFAGMGGSLAPVPTASPATRPGQGDKLRTLADGMQKDIDHKLGDRLENTPKRQREAASARQDGRQMQRAQAGLRALAALHDSGAVPATLSRVTSKKAATDLARAEIDRSNAGYYDAGIERNAPAQKTPDALAFWELLTGPSEAELAAESLRGKLAEIQRSKIPGCFPTPAGVRAVMFESADIRDGDSVLEPNAGSGAIADDLAERYPGAELTCVELNPRLVEILRLKGFNVTQGDFLEQGHGATFDRVLMNPPFERGQDMDHVRAAFDCLKPGGRLVAVMSPSWQHNQNRRAAEFREWFEQADGWTHAIDAGAFKESGTGVATVVVTLEKPESI